MHIFRETGRNAAANNVGLKTPTVKYLSAKSDHADTDYKAGVAFLTLQRPFHGYTKAAEVVTGTWIVSF